MPDYPPLSDVNVTSTIEDIPEMCFIYRDDGLLMALNAICERHLGIPREALIERFNMFQNHILFAPALLQSYRDAFRGEGQIVPATEILLSRPNDLGVESVRKREWLETLIVPMLKREDGTAPYVLAIQRDVTELVDTRLENAAAKQEIEVQRSTIASLEAARREIEAQRATIQALSTPVIEVWDGIVTLPLLGYFDAPRAGRMTEQLLEAVMRTRARYVILDVTGIALIDAAAADQILKIVAAVGLLGATGILVGVQAEIARALVALGVDLGRVRVHQNLRQALKACVREQEMG